MGSDCREEEEIQDGGNGTEENKQTCCVGKILSDTLDIKPRRDQGCKCYEVRIELKQKENKECPKTSSLMPNDIISLERNGQKICIKFEDLLIAIGCEKRCQE